MLIDETIKVKLVTLELIDNSTLGNPFVYTKRTLLGYKTSLPAPCYSYNKTASCSDLWKIKDKIIAKNDPSTNKLKMLWLIILPLYIHFSLAFHLSINKSTTSTPNISSFYNDNHKNNTKNMDKEIMVAFSINMFWKLDLIDKMYNSMKRSIK